ncbi:hypothetical protein A3L14_04575 [Thermococcus thioreducens]|uniref:Uncharacterized protein n=2 Tax=Thermococcus thioreducens TaxID=277988 RepID=A0A0Q2M4I6_9EURY|nr:hypothetical protein A3L14_04575 [Thermococcus thioreducens]KQH82945.1 hypothetical protein AMR53_01570 [Thermococcus thioreducens]
MKNSREVNYVRWKSMLAVLLGLMMTGMTAGTASAISPPIGEEGKFLVSLKNNHMPNSPSEIPFFKYIGLNQEFKLLSDDGTIFNLAHEPTNISIKRDHGATKIIRKYHLGKILVSEIIFVERGKLKTILVVSSRETTNLTILWNVYSPVFRDFDTVNTKQAHPTGTISPTIIGQSNNIRFTLSYGEVYSKFKSSIITRQGISLTFGPFSISQHETLNIGEFEISIQRAPANKIIPMGYYYYTPSPARYPIKRYFDIYDHDGNVVGRAVVAIYGSRKRGSNYAYLEDGMEGFTSVGYAVAPKYGKFHSLYTKFEFCGGYLGSGYPNVPIELNYEALGGRRTSTQFIDVHRTLIDLVSSYIEGGGFIGIMLNGLLARDGSGRSINLLERRYSGKSIITSRYVRLYSLGVDEIGQYYTYTVHLPYNLNEDMIKFCLTVRPGIALPHPSLPTDTLYTRDYTIPIWISLQRP